MSFDLRRDLQILVGVVGLLLVGVGLTVQLRGKMYKYFLPPPETRSALPFHTDVAGAANDLGVLTGGVFSLLLLLPIDLALRRLDTVR